MCVLSSNVTIDLWHFIVYKENIIHIACIRKYLHMYMQFFFNCWFHKLLLFYAKLFSNIELFIRHCLQMQTNKILSLYQLQFTMSLKLELRKNNFYGIIYTCTSIKSFTSCSFLHKLYQQRILSQVRMYYLVVNSWYSLWFDIFIILYYFVVISAFLEVFQNCPI